MNKGYTIKVISDKEYFDAVKVLCKKDYCFASLAGYYLLEELLGPDASHVKDTLNISYKKFLRLMASLNEKEKALTDLIKTYILQ